MPNLDHQDLPETGSPPNNQRADENASSDFVAILGYRLTLLALSLFNAACECAGSDNRPRSAYFFRREPSSKYSSSRVFLPASFQRFFHFNVPAS